mgnify:FL=1
MSLLIKLKGQGLEDITLRGIGKRLEHLARNNDLDNPEEVKVYISNKKGKGAIRIP